MYGILNILGEKVNLVKMDRLCTESYETADIFGMLFHKAFWSIVW